VTSAANLVPAVEHDRILLVIEEVDRWAVRRAIAAARPAAYVVECTSAEQALSAALESSYACVLLDQLLNGSSAQELLPRLLPRLDGAPVIVLTGPGDDRVAVELLKAGASDSLPRDRIGSGALDQALRHAFSLGAARRQLDRVERAQRVYLARLRGLSELTPQLFSAPTVAARVEAALGCAHAQLGAEETFLGVRAHDPPLLCKTRGERIVAIDGEDATWHAILEAPRAPNEARVLVRPLPGGGRLLTMRLASGDGVDLGVFAMRLPALPPVFCDLAESLFAQFGDTTAAAIDNARLYEAAERAVRTRDAIMAVVSHDLRSPLNSFRMGVELLRGDHVSSREAVLMRMDRAVSHMNRLIDDLLDVSRIERGQLQVALGPVPVALLMEDVVVAQVPTAAAAGVELRVPPPPDLRVVADRNRIAQLIANLLSNALRMSPKGGKVSIDAEVATDEVVFSVRDEGPGVPAEARPRVFERYYRRGGKGLGLGLYIARAIVEAHGGRIWIDDAPERGALFRFTLRNADARPQ
jgi:signal transduction histidine kinase/FixJ family two-component response regulator